MKITAIAPLRRTFSASGEITLTQAFLAALETGETPAAVEALMPGVGDSFPVGIAENQCEWISDATAVVDSAVLSLDSGRCWRIEVAGRKCPAAVERRGGVFSAVGLDGVEERRAVFAVPKESLTAFQPNIGDAMAWAGDSFFCTSMQCRTAGNGLILLTLCARKVAEPYRVALSRAEEHAGYLPSGRRYSETVWQAKWRVPASRIADFRQLSGTSAADWAGADAIVTECTEEKLSPVEYQVTVTARNRYSFFRRFSTATLDDRSDLGNRVDIKVTYRDLVISAQQAGFYRSRNDVYLPNTLWNPAVDCPLIRPDGTPFSLFNRNLPTMVVCESRYYRGGVGDNLNRVAEWRGDGAIYSGRLGKHAAKWLRMDIKADNITDNDGRIWTRIDRFYRLPPANCQWNPTYWEVNL